MFAQFEALLNRSQRLVVLTGAGVSADSGVPTFRGSNGIWRNYDPGQLATPQAFYKDPGLVWEFYHWRREVVSKCQPNAAHYALAAVQRKWLLDGKEFTLITQNVDRFHQEAGSTGVIEMHGSLWDLCRTSRTGTRNYHSQPAWEDRTQPLVPALAGRGAPDATAAAHIPKEALPHDSEGFLLRPAVVWFGEDLDSAVVKSVDKVLKACDLFVIIGTSAVVHPAASYAPQMAKRGVPVVEFNLEGTDNSRVCSMTFEGRAGEMLPKAFNVEDEVAAALSTRAHLNNG